MSDEKLDLKELRPVSAFAALHDKLRFSTREVAVLIGLGALVLMGAAVAYVRARPADAASLAPVVATSISEESAARVVVHVVGAVRRPGVYTFAEGERVADAVRAAGGFAPKADGASINLARLLVDGEQIVVPRKGEGGAPDAGSGQQARQGDKLNINLATVADFDSLPGVGPVIAQRIVDYRDQHGPFRTVQDLQKVSGIGPKKFASLEPYLTV